MYIPFKEMPETARIWIYQSTRKFNPKEKEFVTGILTAFCDQWNTHGALMPSSFEIKYDQIIVLSVDESNLGASGCSIDSSVRTLREIEQKLEVNLLDQGKISFIKDGNVLTGKLQEIREYIQGGNLREETPVFNPMVNKKEDLSEKWLVPAKDSWLKKYFVN
ncbi:MAG: hypothetical protein WD426_17125 [Anditalea sp.]